MFALVPGACVQSVSDDSGGGQKRVSGVCAAPR